MSSLLDSINSPQDLRRLTVPQLESLADEVRRLIVEVVSNTGGHLSSNLGVVELTIALHYCFDFLKDRLVWDVSHQCYAHKILTGRREAFHTLRQAGGLSGFTNTGESPYDLFNFGHTGTSVSAALGLACALRRGSAKGEDGPRVVAVIGDGAIASGMPFEAMNHAGEAGADLMVVLNDNKMSISRSVGALARYLDKVRSSRPYLGMKHELRELLGKWPPALEGVEDIVHRVREGIQSALTPGGLFAELGFHYFGPIDGNSVEELVSSLRHLRPIRGPVLLHVLTEKGRGFTPASADPVRFHSSGRFEMRDGMVIVREAPKASGQPAESARTYGEIVGETLAELASTDSRIVAITAAMPQGTGLSAFADRFPDRFYDVGICEQHGVGLAGGLSAGGLRPVLCVYSTFLQRAFDQLFHDIALQAAPVLFCIDRAGLVGNDGPTHHGCHDVALFRSLPGFVVMAPRDGEELAAMIRAALKAGRPCAIRYPKEDVPSPDAASGGEVAIGKAQVLRTGSEAAIVAYGSSVRRAMEAARLLDEGDGLSITVVDARFAKPLDEEAILSVVAGHRAVVLAEEHAPAGGFASAVLELLAERGVGAAHVSRAGLPDRFVNHASRDEQLASLQLDGPGLAERIRLMLRGTPGRADRR